MTTDIGKHVPTDAFRAALEGDIVREVRSGLPAYAPPGTRTRRRERLRTVALLAVGLLFGVGTQLASAQVQDARQRSELERAKRADQEMAALRLTLAKLNEERAREAFTAGALSRQSLVQAEAEVRALEVAVARIRIDLEEIRATAAAPRDELWAPLTAERDFVRERLQMAALTAQNRLQQAEVLAAEAERSFRAGAVAEAAVNDAKLDVSQAKMEFQTLAQRIVLRDQFLKERLSPDEVTRRLERSEVMFEIQHLQDRLKVAESHEALARQREAVGTMDALALKRAEVEVLELKLMLDRLVTRYRALEGAR